MECSSIKQERAKEIGQRPRKNHGINAFKSELALESGIADGCLCGLDGC